MKRLMGLKTNQEGLFDNYMKNLEEEGQASEGLGTFM